MNNALQALVWEQLRKNRTVFPVLASLLILGAWLTHLLAGASPDVWWFRTAQRTLIIAFLASVLLCFAPFTLMESHSGWRMNSMVTRWFVLPVRTGLLVLIPFVAACVVVGSFLGTWITLLQRLTPDLDWLHLTLSLLLGVAAMQTLAWILPRRPGQFWPVLAIAFPVWFMLAIPPLDGPGWATERQHLRTATPFVLPLLGLVAYGAARLNRCGTWPGQLAWPSRLRRLGRHRFARPPLRSPAMALFTSQVTTRWRSFLLFWLGLTTTLVGLQVLLLTSHSSSARLSLALVLQVAVVQVPWLGVFLLAVAGLGLGAEPGRSFCTPLSSFRATLPLRAGTLAIEHLAAGLGLWLIVWVPWLLLMGLHMRLHPQWAGVDLPEIRGAARLLMVVSAHALIGALPLLLWGRLRGFPNALLAGMAAWAGTYCLSTVFSPTTSTPGAWLPLLTLLAAKALFGLSALVHSLRQHHLTRSQALALVAAWSALLGLLLWGLPGQTAPSAWVIATTALLLPFARLTMAPLAIAANRHR